MISWKLFICCLVFTCREACLADVRQNVFTEMKDLKELCPYSSICGQNASSEFRYSDNYRPCCQSCSCYSDCGLRGDCCFSQLDEYNIENGNMICRHSFDVESFENHDGLISSILKRAPHYRMIYKCDNSKTIAHVADKSCEQTSSDAELSYTPMFSPSQGFIYINAYCARCNNVSDTVPWRRAIMCPPDADPVLSEVIDHFDKGEISPDYFGCLPYYIPPPGLNLDAESCYPNVIRDCNITGRMKTRDQSWNFCKVFNATFTIQTFSMLKAYANVYCFICNSDIEPDIIKLMQCTKQRPGTGKLPIVPNVPLTIILDAASVESVSVSRHYDGKSQCPTNSVMVSSFTKTCRPLKCKLGQIWKNNECGYYSKEWIGGPFAVMLRLSFQNRNTLLPASFFKDMPSKLKHDSRAKWIRRKSMRRWKFIVLYHLLEQEPSVEYIVVKAIYPLDSVDPHTLYTSVMKVFEDIWTINYMNATITLNVGLNEFYNYNLIFKDTILSRGVNTTHDTGYMPIFARCERKPIFEYNRMLLFPLSDIRKDELNEGFFVTKLFFCEQIDLLPEEFIYEGCPGEFFFSVKNLTLHTFSIVLVPATSLVNIAVSNSSQMLPGTTLRVCINEFDLDVSTATKWSVRTLGLCTIILSTINYLYL